MNFCIWTQWVILIITEPFGINLLAKAPTPALITQTGVFESSVKSALISKVSSAPLWTPPSPPVANILIRLNLLKIEAKLFGCIIGF